MGVSFCLRLPARYTAIKPSPREGRFEEGADRELERALAPDTCYVCDVDSGQASDPLMSFGPPPSVI